MQNVDELGRAIHDRQVRYRHEVYRQRLASHPVRRWIGTRLIGFGESILAHDAGETQPMAKDRPPT